MSETDTCRSADRSSSSSNSTPCDRASEANNRLSSKARDALSTISGSRTKAQHPDQPQTAGSQDDLATAQVRLAVEGREAKGRVERGFRPDESVTLAQHFIEAPEAEPDAVTNLAQTGTAEEARDFMVANPDMVGDVLDAFAQERPGMVPDVVEASADAIVDLAPEAVLGEPSFWTRAWGALRTVGGAFEAAAGGAVVAAPDPFIVTDVLGGAAFVHGVDNMQAGARQVWTGRPTESGTELAAETIAEALGADPAAAELIGDGVDIALGLGLGSVSGIRSLADLARRTGTVWDNIRPSVGTTNWGNTIVPRAFELRAGTTRLAETLWVHPNASEHIGERSAALAVRLAAKGQPEELAHLSSQLQLSSLQRAVTEAVQGGVPIGQTTNVAGWQLSFAAPREAGQLPVLFHAIPLDYIQ